MGRIRELEHCGALRAARPYHEPTQRAHYSDQFDLRSGARQRFLAERFGSACRRRGGGTDCNAVGGFGAPMSSQRSRRGLIPICSPLGRNIGRSRFWREFLFIPRAKSIPLIASCREKSFVATRFFNEFWQPAQLGLSAAGANLLVEDQFSALIFFSNAPDKEFLTTQQMHIFEVAVRHLSRACANKSTARGTGARAGRHDGTTREPARRRFASRCLGQSSSRERRRGGHARRRQWNFSRQRTSRRQT